MSLGKDLINDHMYEMTHSSYRRSVKKSKRRPMFTRGYHECRAKLSANSLYSRSCFNCAFYYQASGDKEEVCQNDSVLEYDMVVDKNNICCLKWQPVNKDEEHLFKKNGRSILD